MKNKLTKTMFMVMAGAMMFGTALPVYATVDETQTVGEVEAEGGTTREALVKYNQASTFTVTIPKTVTLDGATKTSDYTVNVKGDISSDKEVSVAPDTTFAMKDKSEAIVKKDDVTATVTQDATVWSSAEVCVANTGTDKNGNIEAKDLTAGTWEGVFNFDIAMNDVQ